MTNEEKQAKLERARIILDRSDVAFETSRFIGEEANKISDSAHRLLEQSISLMDKSSKLMETGFNLLNSLNEDKKCIECEADTTSNTMFCSLCKQIYPEVAKISIQ